MLKTNKKAIYIFIIFIILGIFLRAVSLNNELTGEESDFVKAAIAVNQKGSPIFYQSEQRPLQVALWHPPMYIYLLSLITWFSTSEIAVRALNVVATLLTAILIYLFCKFEIEGKGKKIGLIASSLFLINFYVLSSSLLIDIDALSMLFVFSFLFFTLRNYKRRDRFSFVLAACALLFSLANRYPIAVLVYGAVFLILIGRRDRAYIKSYFLLGVGAAIIFLIIWTFYSTVIEPGTFWYFISHSFTLGSEQFSEIYLFSFMLNMAQVLRLTTLPAMILFLMAIYYFRKNDNLAIKMILISTLIVFLFFVIVPRPAFGYPRYFLSAMPGLFILVSLYLYETLANMRFKKSSLLLLLVSGLITLLILVLLNPQLTLYRNDGLIKATNLPDFLLNVAGALPLLLVMFKEKRNRKVLFATMLFFLLIVYSLYFDWKFFYQESQAKKVGQYLQDNTGSSDIIICPKAVGYYAERRFYANDYHKPPIEDLSADFLKEYFIKSMGDKEMESDFFWGDDLYGGVFYADYQTKDAGLQNAKYVVLSYDLSGRTHEARIGEYRIYKVGE